MQSVTVRRLRSDFTTAISSTRNDLTLDPSIAKLREKISEADFLKPFSIYSKAHLRRIDDLLHRISNARLRDNPLQVAVAVESILELFARLEVTVRQSVESDRRIEANRSC